MLFKSLTKSVGSLNLWFLNFPLSALLVLVSLPASITSLTDFL